MWFQVFHKNGTIEINKGENGLVRLDNIVKPAKDKKLHVVFALTNTWFRGATGGDGGDKHDRGDKHGGDKHKQKNPKRG